MLKSVIPEVAGIVDEVPELPPEQLPVVPLHRPYRSPGEEAYVLDALRSGVTHGDGPYTRRCHAALADALGTSRVMLTTSCTTALEMAAILSRRGPPGSPAGEVICPAYTFMSTAGAFVTHGFRPVFADVREDTLNLDERQVEALIGPETRAVVAVHYAGVPAEMGPLRELAARHGVALVEDAAHALFASYRGRPVGTLGDFAAFSFHATKNFSCGEGGALVVRDPALTSRALHLREKGTNREDYRRGLVAKYSWVDLGGSYLPSDLLAAQLLGQLEARDHIQARRRARFERYRDGLADVAAAGDLRLPTVPTHVEASHHLFHVRLRDPAARPALTAHLSADGIVAAFHYPALHLTPKGRTYGPTEGALPVAEAAARALLRLPLYPDLSVEEVDRAVDSVRRFFGR